MEMLSQELARDELESLGGLGIDINGAVYRLGEFVGSGAEAAVYELVNCKTGLNLFVIKVYRFPPDSPEFTKKLASKRAHFQWVASKFYSAPDSELKFDDLLMGGLVVPVEFYAYNGVLVGIQYSFRPATADYYSSDMSRAEALYSKGNYGDAIRSLDCVLERNSSHSEALAMKATCLSQLSSFADVMALFQTSLELEPNARRWYRICAEVYHRLEMPSQAMAVLERTLKRYEWDFTSWLQLIRVATEFDMTDLVVPLRWELVKYIPTFRGRRDVRLRVEESRDRWKRYREQMWYAADLQFKGQWAEAATELTAAMQISKGNQVPLFNIALCLFHQEKWSGCLDVLNRVFGQLPKFMKPCASATALVASIREKRIDVAVGCVDFILECSPTLFDLPKLCSIVLEDLAIEQKDVAILIKAIDELLLVPELLDPEKRKVSQLVTKYREWQELVATTDSAEDRQPSGDTIERPPKAPRGSSTNLNDSEGQNHLYGRSLSILDDPESLTVGELLGLNSETADGDAVNLHTLETTGIDGEKGIALVALSDRRLAELKSQSAPNLGDYGVLIAEWTAQSEASLTEIVEDYCLRMQMSLGSRLVEFSPTNLFLAGDHFWLVD